MYETVEQLRAMPYGQYLESRWWKFRRGLKLKDEPKCQNPECKFEYELEVHHLSYENLGDEKDGDLMVLCVRCHDDLHYNQRRQESSELMVRQNYQITENEYKQHSLFVAKQ
jgi:5-methylcytosine-specific restriction endonuclease McrA